VAMNADQLRGEYQSIKRRQAIAQMLMQQGQEPIQTNQTAGGYVVPVSPLSAISKMAQQLSGAYIGKKTDERQQAYDKNKSALQAQAISDYTNSPDKRAAAISVISNQMLPPEIKAAAINELKSQNKQQLPKSGTPGQFFIPAGAKPENFDGLQGFRLPDGSFIPSRAAMTDYQKEVTDPVKRAKVSLAVEGTKGVKATDSQGHTFYAPQSSLNPDFNPTNTIPNLINVESGGDPNAVSSAGAVGSTQIMPDTAKNPGYGVKPINTNSVRDQVRGGADYLLGLMDDYMKQGMPEAKAYTMALAAYNQGPGNVARRGPGAGGISYANKVMGQSPAEEAMAKAEAVIPATLAEKQGLNKLDVQKTQNEKTAAMKFSAQQAQPILDKVMELLPQAPSGGMQGNANSAMNFLGIDTNMSRAQSQLDATAADLTSKVPRAPGAQSDVELKWAQKQAGDLANPNLPYQSRVAAAKYLYERNQKILNGEEVSPPKEATSNSELEALRKKYAQ